MYIPKQFEETGTEVIQDLINAYPLATLVTHSATGLNANHIPLHYSVSSAPHGILRGHIARANPLCAEISDGIDALAIFHGPSAYISPSWYATKKQTGKVVPTWNYTVVHAYGRLCLVDDAPWLRAQLDALTEHNEASFPEPWKISDVPKDYIENIMTAIVGIELLVTKLIAKSKLSQNQPAQNRNSVVDGLSKSDLPGAKAMAVLMGDTE